MLACRLKITNDISHVFLLGFLLPFVSSCATIGYYAQSIKGQLDLLAKRTPITTVVQHPDTSDELKVKLGQVLDIREFASDQLSLPRNGSYKNYVDTGREFVVWNIFATPKLSLEPLKWCFLIVGCLNYRGYFSKEAADHFAQELKSKDFDVFVGGVAAYSTLGWFDDPLLNTMLRRDNIYLAKVIFHELAHQKIHIQDDTEFNEAFADAVALLGVRRWIVYNSLNEIMQDFESQQLHENQFVELVLTTRDKLDTLYKSSLPDSLKLLNKTEILDTMRSYYTQMKVTWGNKSTYDKWFNGDLNNAKLMAVITYRNLIPGFLELFKVSGGDLDDFYTQVERLGKCSPDKRRRILQTVQTVFDC